MEKEFIKWYKSNQKRFAHGQFDEKQIAYSAWVEGRKQSNDVTETKTSTCPNCNGEGFSGKGTKEILPCFSCFGSGEKY